MSKNPSNLAQKLMAVSLCVIAVISGESMLELKAALVAQDAVSTRRVEALERIADSLEGGCETGVSVGFGPSLEALGWTPWPETSPFLLDKMLDAGLLDDWNDHKAGTSEIEGLPSLYGEEGVLIGPLR